MILSTEKDFIIEMIKKYPVETLHIKGRLAHGSAKYYVDDLENTQVCVVEHQGWLAPFSENISKMIEVLCHFVKEETVGFCGLPLNIAEAILDGLPSYEKNWVERCALYYLPESEYKNFLDIKTTLDKINKDDIPTVYEHYTYKDDDNENYLLDCINSGPSSVIRNDQEAPISWALLREDGSLGVMYTLEEVRKKGLAMQISKDLIKKVIKMGYQPYAHIVVNNSASRKLAEQLGMICYGDVLWFGMIKTKSDD